MLRVPNFTWKEESRPSPQHSSNYNLETLDRLGAVVRDSVKSKSVALLLQLEANTEQRPSCLLTQNSFSGTIYCIYRGLC